MIKRLQTFIGIFKRLECKYSTFFQFPLSARKSLENLAWIRWALPKLLPIDENLGIDDRFDKLNLIQTHLK